MKYSHSLSVIVPVYNEAILLQAALEKMDHFLKDRFNNYEILIIESGSNDGSSQICDEIIKTHMNIRVIHEGNRNGFGSALKLGYAHANKDLIWMVTVDLPFALESLDVALPLLSKYECVLSYRSKDNRDLAKKIRSLVFNNWVKYSLGLKVKHVNSAFKLFKKSVIKDMNFKSNGWFIDTEIIYRLQKAKVSFVEIPVELKDRQGSQSSVGAGAPLHILKEWSQFLAIKDQ